MRSTRTEVHTARLATQLTFTEIRNRIYKRYKPLQIVNMRERSVEKNEITRRFKAEIVKFYPYHVDCIVNGYHESFTYWDMMMLARKGGNVIAK